MLLFVCPTNRFERLLKTGLQPSSTFRISQIPSMAALNQDICSCYLGPCEQASTLMFSGMQAVLIQPLMSVRTFHPANRCPDITRMRRTSFKRLGDIVSPQFTSGLLKFRKEFIFVSKFLTRGFKCGQLQFRSTRIETWS